MKNLVILVLLRYCAHSEAYITKSFTDTCLDANFNIFLNSTPDTCYGRRQISVALSWAGAWEECTAFGSGPGRKSLTIQPTTLDIHTHVLRPGLSAARGTSLGLMFQHEPCRIYRADYWGLEPAWVERDYVFFDGTATELCNPEVHSTWGRAPMAEHRGAVWDSHRYYGDGHFDDTHVRHGWADPKDQPINGPGDHILCQLQKGQLVRTKSRSEEVLAKHRFATLTSPSLGHCSFACLRDGGCFGLGFGKGRCQLYRLATAEMEGGWEATDGGLKLYAFDWPRRS